MIISPEQAQQLAFLRVYAITGYTRTDRPAEEEGDWENVELLVSVQLSGWGTPHGNVCPTWSSNASAPTFEEAFDRALTYAPAQRDAANARAENRLGDILPEYDPDGTRFPKRRARAKSTGPKLSAEELDKLLEGL